DEVHLPLWLIAVVDGCVTGGQVYRDVVVDRVEVEEVVLDDLTLVAQCDDELVHAAGLEDLHDVPQDGPAAYLHHGLGPRGGLLGQAGAEAPCQDHSLHALTSSLAVVSAPPPIDLKCLACLVRRSSMRRPAGRSTSRYEMTSSLATSRLSLQPSATPMGSSDRRVVSDAVSHRP